MEAELRADFPEAKIRLAVGSGGVFDVKCNGKLIYSKHKMEQQRFPDDGEITGLIRKEIG